MGEKHTWTSNLWEGFVQTDETEGFGVTYYAFKRNSKVWNEQEIMGKK